MYTLPVEPYLIELLDATDLDDCPLVVAGGLGIYLKHRWVRQQVEQQGRELLLDPLPLPDARATTDIDAFMPIDIFLRDLDSGVRRFREILDNLGYQAYAKGRYFQFVKPMVDQSGRVVKIDLHTRSPLDDEMPGLKVEPNGVRVSKKGTAARRTVDAWRTREAFAIDHGIQILPLTGLDPSGTPRRCTVRVPHPFASLCMKITAARDHERAPAAERNPEKHGEKHAADVYLLMAMLSAEEREQTRNFIEKFHQIPEFAEICAAVSEIFRDPNHVGCHTIRGQYDEIDVDLARFCFTLCELFAPPLPV